MFSEFKFAKKNWQNYNPRRLSKPVGVQLFRLSAEKEMGSSFKVFTISKFSTSRLKSKFGPNFVPQKKEFLKIEHIF